MPRTFANATYTFANATFETRLFSHSVYPKTQIPVSLIIMHYTLALLPAYLLTCREGPCLPLRARSFAIGLTIATASSVELLRHRLDRLQSILNATARLVLNIPKFSHISLAIRDELHWLPVQCRSQYKICILVRNSIAGFSPQYLQELCLPVASVLGRQHLRSAGRNDLLVPQFRTVNYGLRGFSISGPRLWNTLPHDIRQSVGNLNLFKNKLKTYFFQLQQRLCGSSSPVAL